MPRDLLLYLEDIQEAITSIRSYVGDRSFEEFAGDPMCLDAVVLRFITIGEAVKQIPATWRSGGERSPGSGISVSTHTTR